MRADSRFHIELAAATRSTHLAARELTAQAELTPLIWNHATTTGSCRRASAEHRAIVSAIRARDPETARLLAEAHVSTGIDFLVQMRLDAEPRAKSFAVARTSAENQSARESLNSAITSEAEAWQGALDLLSEAAIADLGEGTHSVEQMIETEGVATLVLERSDLGLFAAGFVALPQAFGGREGYVWLHRSLHADGIRHFDPEAATDAGNTLWLTRLGEDTTHATGPYVDASGTNQYVITLSKSVRVRGQFVGVVAVDVTVRTLQRRFHRYLAAFPPGSCLVDETGAVLVTNTGRLLGRHLRRPDGFVSAEELSPTGWKLVIGQQPLDEPRTSLDEPRTSTAAPQL